MKYIAFGISLLATSFSTTSPAIGFRCENDLVVEHRDSKATILQKCGQPFYVEQFCVPIGDSEAPVVYLVPNMPFVPPGPCRFVEEWYVNPGPGQLTAIVRFEGGASIVQSIRYGDRIR